MSAARSDSTTKVDALELAEWRHAHEVRSLQDMLCTYRDWAAAVAAENAALREELAIVTAPRVQPHAPARTRNRCRA
jgi:hypothetical protein